MYLLTEWECRTEKYWAHCHGVRTEQHDRVAKYFPVRPDLTQSISILSYDPRAFPFSLFFSFFFLRLIKFAIGIFSYVAHFDRNVGIYLATNLFRFASRKEPNAILAGPDGLFPPCSRHRVRPGLIRGFSQ